MDIVRSTRWPHHIVAASIMFSLLVVTSAFAVTPTPTPTSTPLDCGAGITFNGGTNTLTNDYIQTGNYPSACITLINNADLDMNGHTITRAFLDWSNQPRAIACTSGGSAVTGPGTIRGAFYYGITNCETVDSLTFTTHVGTDTYDLGPTISIFNDTTGGQKADLITNNVITTRDAYGIASAMLSSTSSISDNYIESYHPIEVWGTSSGSGPLVENNLLRFYWTGIMKPDTSIVRIRKNLLIEHIDNSYACLNVTASGATVSDNFCDCEDQCPIVPPYNFPWY